LGDIFIKNFQSMRVVPDGTEVLLLHNGVLIAAIPWRQAEELAKAIWGVARLCDRLDNIEAVAADATIMKEAGVPRRFTDAFVGIPNVVRHKPKETKNG
jgi:hypothetical protein